MHVLVVGAGLLGLSTAFCLRKGGHRVTVVDRHDAAGQECSHANGGILHAGNAAPWNAPGVVAEALRQLGRRDASLRFTAAGLMQHAGWGWRFLRNSGDAPYQQALQANMRLAQYSMACMRQIQQRHGIGAVLRKSGSLCLYTAGPAWDAARSAAERGTGRALGAAVLDRRALRSRLSALCWARPELVGAIAYPNDASGDALGHVEALATALQRDGAEFLLGVAVQRLRTDSEGWCAAETDRGALCADACVLAAGSASVALLHGIGHRLDIAPVRGHSITLSLPERATVPKAAVIDMSRRIVATRLGQRLRVAGFAELVGFDTRPDPSRVARLRAFAGELVPELAHSGGRERCEAWAGLRPTSADGRPFLGEGPVPGLFLATGTGHLGWTMAAGAGQLVADIVSGSRPALDPSDYAYRLA